MDLFRRDSTREVEDGACAVVPELYRGDEEREPGVTAQKTTGVSEGRGPGGWMRRHCSVFVCFYFRVPTDSVCLQVVYNTQQDYSDGRAVGGGGGAQYCLFKTNIYKNVAS